MKHETFTEPTTQYWQHLADGLPVAETRPPFRFSYPVRLPDGRWLKLPIRTRQQDPDRAVASFIANHASFSVIDTLAEHMATLVAALAPEIVVGLPTLGLALAGPLARRLGHDRIVPLGTSRKYWYDDRWSEETRSVTTAAPRRLYVDPNLVAMLIGRRVLVVDDTISSGTTARAAFSVLKKIGVEPAGFAVVMSQGDLWRSRLDAAQGRLVKFVFQTPHFVRDRGSGGWRSDAPG